MTTRIADVDDAAAIARLNLEFNQDAATPEQIADRMVQSQHIETVVLAEIDKTVVGFACIQMRYSACYPDPWAELTEVYVQTPHRSKGVGRAMVSHAEQVAYQRGATVVVVLTGTYNDAGQALYQSLDYKQREHLVFQERLEI